MCPQGHILVFETREGGVFGLWGMGRVSYEKLGVARWHVFCGEKQVGLWGRWERVSYVDKMKINSERTLYTHPV